MGSYKNQSLMWSYIKERELTMSVPSAPAFSDSIRHSSTRRVNHGHEADETQVVGGEVHFISVKGKAFWELVVRQTEMAETYKMEMEKPPQFSHAFSQRLYTC
uniref:Uncharacterized protein n=1 Tax=Cynoglossus semilaevis TaxID=244447 RepID=A0A3P8UEC3_CYNSE